MVSASEPVIVRMVSNSGTNYDTTLRVNRAEELRVWVTLADGTAALKTLGTDYTVTLSSANIAAVTFTVLPATDSVLTFIRATDRDQNLDLIANTRLPAEDFEAQFDKLTRLIREQAETRQAIRFPEAEPAGSNSTLPLPAIRANGSLHFDGSGNMQVISMADLANLTVSSSTVQTALAADRPGARTAMALGSAATESATAFAPASHTHNIPSVQITDATAQGRALLTSATAALQRAALGIIDSAPVQIDNVLINSSSLANRDALLYEASSDKWKNRPITAADIVGGVAPTGPQVISALGYTPANVASPTFTGHVQLSGQSTQLLNDNSAMTKGLVTSFGDARYATLNNDALNTQRYCTEKVLGWTSNLAPPINLLFMGDSLSSYLTPFANMPQMGSISNGYYLLSGTAPSSLGTGDWVTGQVINVPVGTIIQYHPSGQDKSFIGSKVCVGFIAEDSGLGAGVGSFDLELQKLSDGSTGAWTKVGITQSTYSATKVGVYYTVDVPTVSNAPAYKFRITNVTGKPIKLICWGIYSHNAGGVVPITGVANLTGRDVVRWTDCPDAIFNPIFTGLNSDLVISRWADPASEWRTGGNFVGQYQRMKAVKNKTDFIQVSGNTTYAVEDLTNTWPAYVSGQSTYRVGDWAKATNDTTGIVGRYVCTVAHTQSAATKPGQGANWTSYWTGFIYDPAILASSKASVRDQAAAQAEWAAKYGETFIDSYSVFGDYPDAFKNELIGDLVHPTSKGWMALNNSLNRQVNIATRNLFGSVSSDGRFTLEQREDNLLYSNRSLMVDTGGNGFLGVFDSAAGNDRTRCTYFSQASGVSTWSVNKSAVINAVFSGTTAHQVLPGNSGGNVSLGSSTYRWKTFTSGFCPNIVTKTANYTPTVQDATILCNATSGAITISLPYLDSSSSGQIYVIKKIDSSANSVTVTHSNGTTTIDGVTSQVISTLNGVLRIQWDGTKFYLI